MKYLHTMLRIKDLEDSLSFYTEKLGLKEVRRTDYESGRFTLIFLAAPDDFETASVSKSPLIELTYNWDEEIYSGGRNFGHLAFGVQDIYDTCAQLAQQGISILRPPRDGYMAFIKSPDGVSIELLQIGEKLPPQEPWLSMQNHGSW